VRLPRHVRRLCQASLDLTIAFAAFTTAALSIVGGDAGLASLPATALVVAALRVATSFAFGSYRQLWRYTSLKEVLHVGIAAALVSAVLLGGALLALLPVPAEVVAIDFALFFLGAASVRVLRRLSLHVGGRGASRVSSVGYKRTLMIGAGRNASLMIRDVQRNNLPMVIEGILDDDPEKIGSELHGVKVLGSTDQLAQVLDRSSVQNVIVTMTSAPKEKLDRIIAEVRKRALLVKVAPAYHDIASGLVNHGRSGFRLDDLLDIKEIPHTVKKRLDQHRDRTVLVTGGAGYIGSHLVGMLLNKGFRVRVLDNFTYGRSGLAALADHPNLEIVEGDIANVKDVVRCVKNVGTVVALAAIVGDPACGLNPEETLNLNYESTKILVEAARFYGVKRFVFASSCSVYGASESCMLTEDSPLHPVSLYARTRIMSEDVLLESCGDMEPVILRLSTVFGYSPRMRFDLVVNTLTVRGVVDGRFQIFGGKQWRPFVHCRDVARAFALAVTASSEAVKPVIFNVGGNDMNFTLAQIGEIVGKQIHRAEVAFAENNDDPRNYRVKFDRIRQHLQFTPEVSIEAGVREMIERIEGDSRLRKYGDPVFSNLASLKSAQAPAPAPTVASTA
jgi:nucleoside-diphosphate-sugar epimerase